MPEAKITPIDIEDNAVYRYARETWLLGGVDNYTNPPAQNQDMFIQLTNALPPATGVFLRRYAYRTFFPKLDTGSGDGS